MRGRKGDWRDLLRAYALALGAKKVWLGLVGVLATMAIVAVLAMACGTLVERGLLPESNKVAVLVAPKDPGNVFQSVIDARVEQVRVEFHSEFPFVEVEALGSLALILPLLNPFGGNLLHFLLSILFYLALIAVWTRCGGIITRLAALEYARDDLPTAREAKDMVRARRRAYLLAPLIPLVGILFCALANILLGLASSIPWGVGPWLLAVGTVGSVFVTILMTFLIVVGALSFGLMVPVVSISGGDAFESWAASYSYTLWGFGQLVCYRLLTWVLGVAAVVFAALVAKVFLSVLVSSIGLGVVGSGSLAGSGPQALGVQVAA
ncbi:MAG: hypothetical protein QGH74_01560, partial [Candidatus Brocadiia bacterium]|nr:hypothetical protein [Candidatus Brocadiia bacterium]